MIAIAGDFPYAKGIELYQILTETSLQEYKQKQRCLTMIKELCMVPHTSSKNLKKYMGVIIAIAALEALPGKWRRRDGA